MMFDFSFIQRGRKIAVISFILGIVCSPEDLSAQYFSEIDSLLKLPKQNYLETEGYASETFSIFFIRLMDKYGSEEVFEQCIAIIEDEQVPLDYKIMTAYQFQKVLMGITTHYQSCLQTLYAVLEQAYETYRPECKSGAFLIVKALTLASQKDYVQAQSVFSQLKHYIDTHQCGQELILYHLEMSNGLYHVLNSNLKALEHDMKSLHIMDSLNSLHIPIPLSLQLKVYGEVANIHYYTQNWHLAIDFWKKSMKLIAAERVSMDHKTTALLNNIGVSYKKLTRYDSAIFYFRKCIALAEVTHDDVWIGIAKGNLGSIFLEQGNYAAAKPLLMEDARKSLRNAEPGSFINSLESIGRLHFFMNRYDSARLYYDSALHYYRSMNLEVTPLTYRSLSKIYHQYAELEQATGNYRRALEYEKLASTQDDSVTYLLKRQELSILQAYHQFENQYTELQLANSRIRNHQLRETIFLIIALMTGLTILFGLIVYRLRFKRIKAEAKASESAQKAEAERARRLEDEIRATNEINRLEQEKAREIIAFKERELSSIGLQIQEKNEVMNNLKNQLEKISVKESTLQHEFRSLYRSIRNSLNVNSDWERYKVHFEQVHPDFFTKLVKIYPELSLGDLRICAYIRMNIDNHSMARILNVSTDSLRVRRHRLRKKMEFDSDKDLFNYLCSLED